MKLRRVKAGDDLHVELLVSQGWVQVAKCLAQLKQRRPEKAHTLATDIVALLGAPADVRAAIVDAARKIDPETTAPGAVVIPFEPRSFRDFMLYESHAIAAARGFVRKQMPGAFQAVSYTHLTLPTIYSV